jgi:rhodanese-related sulfurtransferase
MTIKLLNTGTLLFAALLAAGLLFAALTSGKYNQSNGRVLEKALDESFVVGYGELQGLLDEPERRVLLVDLRPAEAFAAGHLPGAINIPAAQILDQNAQGPLKEKNRAILLYAAEEHEAATVAMLLMGKQKKAVVRVVAGGFEDIRAQLLEGPLDPSFRYFRDDKARFDYNRFMKTATQADGEETAPPPVPEFRTEVVSVQGGC